MYKYLRDVRVGIDQSQPVDLRVPRHIRCSFTVCNVNKVVEITCNFRDRKQLQFENFIM